MKQIIHKEYDDKDIATTDDRKLVAFYALRDVQPLYVKTGRDDKLLFTYCKSETAEYYDIWKSLKPVNK